MESFNGGEEKNIRDIGKMENNMEKDCYIALKIKLGEKVCGKMEKGLNGLRNEYLVIFIKDGENSIKYINHLFLLIFN